jgi:hypothetical protein
LSPRDNDTRGMGSHGHVVTMRSEDFMAHFWRTKASDLAF